MFARQAKKLGLTDWHVAGNVPLFSTTTAATENPRSVLGQLASITMVRTFASLIWPVIVTYTYLFDNQTLMLMATFHTGYWNQVIFSFHCPQVNITKTHRRTYIHTCSVVKLLNNCRSMLRQPLTRVFQIPVPSIILQPFGIWKITFQCN